MAGRKEAVFASGITLCWRQICWLSYCSFFHHLIEQPNVVLVLSKIAIASGYIAVAGWAVGFSLIYQPALSKK